MPIDQETGEILIVPGEQLNAFENVERKFSTPYTHSKLRSDRFATINTLPSLTQQSDAQDADINVIVKRFTGHNIPNPNKKIPMFGDFSSGETYRDLVEKVRVANEEFQAIPAETRARFNNDPARLIEFLKNPENTEEARKLGLAPPAPPKPTPPEPMAVRIVPDTPPGGLPPGVPPVDLGNRPGQPR